MKKHYDIILQHDDIEQVRYIFDVVQWSDDAVEVKMFYNSFLKNILPRFNCTIKLNETFNNITIKFWNYGFSVKSV